MFNVFKLIRWIAYGFFAYFIYDVVTSINRQKPAAKPRLRSHQDRPSNFTGETGQGTYVPVEDATGAHRTAKVGRGVVS